MEAATLERVRRGSVGDDAGYDGLLPPCRTHKPRLTAAPPRPLGVAVPPRVRVRQLQQHVDEVLGQRRPLGRVLEAVEAVLVDHLEEERGGDRAQGLYDNI